MKESLYELQIIGIILAFFMLELTNPVNGQGVDTTKVKNGKGNLVNIAYGKEKPQAIGGAISTVTSETLEKSTVTNAGNALFGRLSGLIVNQRGGEPGNDSPSFMIRGNTSYSGSNGPLIIVDGFQRSIDQLVPGEIETISVLKDAAATAMYGIKGANGVILVTTKRGIRSAEKIGISVATGIQEPTRLPNFVNSYNYAKLHNEALANDGLPLLYSEDDIQKYKDGSDPYFHPDVKWLDEILRKSSPLMQAGVTFTGGSESVRHFVMVNYMVNQGLLKNTDWNDGYSTDAKFHRLNFRSNLDINVTKHLVASLDIGVRIEHRNDPGTSIGTIFSNIYSYVPNMFPVLNPNGSFGGSSAYQGNPLGLVTSTGYTASDDRNLQSAFRLEQDLDFIAKGLKVGTVAAFDNWQRYTETYTRSFPVYQLSTDANSSVVYKQYGQVTPLSRKAGNRHNYRMNFEAYLDYAKKSGKNEITAKFLYHQDEYGINWTTDNNTPYLLNGASGRLAYGYNDRYFVEFVAGYNGTDRFPGNKRFGFFPAGALSWVLSKEDFVKSHSWINYLKARASYGLVGNDNIGADDRYLYIPYYINSGSYPYGNSNKSVTATREANSPNYNITWEKAYKVDLGIEGHLFNCIDFALGYFHEKRTDIVDLQAYQIPSILGISAGYVNNGIASRQGFEATIQLTKQTGDFGYSLGVNGIITQSRIDHRSEPAYPNQYQYSVGHPVGQNFGLEAIGFLSQADIDNPQTPVYSFQSVQPGDVKYKDQDKNGVIDSNDELPIGKSVIPTLYYGISFGIKYKAISLDGLLQGLGGEDIYVNGFSGPMGNMAQISDYVQNRWTPEASTTAEFPRLTTLGNSNNYRNSTLWLRSGDYIRLRSIELAYELPEKSLSFFHVSTCKIFLQGMNLFTLDKIKALDPENLSGYPALKSYNVGLRLQL